MSTMSLIAQRGSTNRDMKLDPKFLVVSIGNPLPKYESLHSAGHFALNGLAKVLRHPPFRETSIGGQQYFVSQGSKYTLVQSPTLMNVSGSFVLRVWKQMHKQHDAASLSLVVVHDELEKGLGVVNLVSWERSPRGHNGMKSVKNSISQKVYPVSPLARIAIGIGRPAERDPESVARYVLAQIPSASRNILENEAPFGVAKKLAELEDEWRKEVEP